MLTQRVLIREVTAKELTWHNSTRGGRYTRTSRRSWDGALRLVDGALIMHGSPTRSTIVASIFFSLGVVSVTLFDRLPDERLPTGSRLVRWSFCSSYGCAVVRRCRRCAWHCCV